jgi:hypothetical protein
MKIVENKLTQEQINDNGIYQCLIEIAFNAHSKCAAANNKEDYDTAARYQALERRLLDIAHDVFHNQSF